MKRSTCQAKAPKKGSFICPDSDFAAQYPALAAGLCDEWWDDGKPRECFSLSINICGGDVRVSLIDKEMSQSSYTSAPTLAEALSLIDAALAAETVSWRRWKKK